MTKKPRSPPCKEVESVDGPPEVLENFRCGDVTITLTLWKEHGFIRLARDNNVSRTIPVAFFDDDEPPDKDPEKEGAINSEPCPECNASIPYGPGTEYESHPDFCPICGANMEGA